MKTITILNKKLHFKRQTRKYEVVKEYPRYYLCECIQDGKKLYRECFLKVEIRGVKEVPRTMDPRVGWHM
jgi:hypothetical protein